MQTGLAAHVFHGEGQLRLIAADGLVLRPMVGKQAAHILHAGNQIHVQEENSHTDHPLQEVDPQVAGNPPVKQAANDHGKQEEQAHGHSQTQHHGKAHQGLLEALISQLFFQPLVKLGGGLCLSLLRGEVRRPHQSLHPYDVGAKEVIDPPDQGPSQGRMLRRQLPGGHLHREPLLAPDHHSVFVRPPHHNSLNEGLTADHGFKFLL